MAPMRAAAAHDTSHAGSFGNSTPIRVPFTAPASTSRAASARDRRSSSANVIRSSGVTRNTLSGQRSADALPAFGTVGGNSGNPGSVITPHSHSAPATTPELVALGRAFRDQLQRVRQGGAD